MLRRIRSLPPLHVVNGVVFVGSQDKTLYALDALTGILLWGAGISGTIDWSSPAVADGRVYVGSMDNHLYAYRLDPSIVSLSGVPRPDPRTLVPDLTLRPQSR